MPRAKKSTGSVESNIIGSNSEVKRIPNLDVFPKEKEEEAPVIEIKEIKETNKEENGLSNINYSDSTDSLSCSNVELNPQQTQEVKSFLTKDNFQKLSKAVLVNPLFSLFLINLFLDGILLKGALWLFIGICIINDQTVKLKE